jgi:hypothetical protein
MRNEAINTLVERWSKPNQIPFKGSLISYQGGTTCMCAQGQALHYIGGWNFDRLRNADQAEADKATAKLLGISRAHAVLLRNTNDSKPGAPSIVLTNPELVIGANAPAILAFWRHLDTMTVVQWAAARDAARGAAGAAARDAAGAAAGAAAWDAAGAAARGAAGAAAWGAAGVAAWATAEIMGAEVLRERGKAFFFLPTFGFPTLEAVLAAVSA